MPEGDTIFRSAQRLRPVMVDRQILAASHRNPHVAVDKLVGRHVRSVESRGKHLLMATDGELVIHSHMGMTGAWHIYGAEETWRKPKTYAELVLEMSSGVGVLSDAARSDLRHFVVCFTPKLLEILTPTQVRRHRWLSRLGPDILAHDFSTSQILPRARSHGKTTIAEVLMNQSVVCGIGNVYKSEALFVCRQDPFESLESVDDARLTQILETAARLMQRNLFGYPRQTRDTLGGDRMWVYRRSGQPCYRCASRIRMRRQGDLGRSTYWCPSCQPRR